MPGLVACDDPEAQSQIKPESGVVQDVHGETDGFAGFPRFRKQSGDDGGTQTLAAAGRDHCDLDKAEFFRQIRDKQPSNRFARASIDEDVISSLREVRPNRPDARGDLHVEKLASDGFRTEGEGRRSGDGIRYELPDEVLVVGRCRARGN